MSSSFDFTHPSRVTVGEIGPPGQRTFYLQARQEDQLVSLKLEKEQVLLLAGALNEVLSDLPRAAAPANEPELEEPVLPEWAVGTMELSYDASADKVVIVAVEVGSGDEEPEPVGYDGAMARLSVSRDQAAGLIERGRELLRAGRPLCPLCGYPMGEDHSCPKTNGHRAPSL
jgi:uncharacterized repeat protein (TIGR03847 family)